MRRIHQENENSKQIDALGDTHPGPSTPNLTCRSSRVCTHNCETHTSSSLEHETWKKVLWKRQRYPDNYTDTTFLKELVINADVPRRGYWKVVLGSLIIIQQLSISVIAITLPVYLRQPHAHHLGALIAASLLLNTIGYIAGTLHAGSYLTNTVQAVDQACMVSLGTHLGAPALQLLAGSLGRDSLIAGILFLLLGHLYTYDYNFKDSTTDSFLGAASQAAAITSTVLASTFIPQPLHAALYTLLTSTLFLATPYPRQLLRATHAPAHIALSLTLASAAHRLLAPLSADLTSVLMMACVFISLLCPWWLIRIHKFKAKINGPWDEAVPNIPTSIHPENISETPRA